HSAGFVANLDGSAAEPACGRTFGAELDFEPLATHHRRRHIPNRQARGVRYRSEDNRKRAFDELALLVSRCRDNQFPVMLTGFFGSIELEFDDTARARGRFWDGTFLNHSFAADAVDGAIRVRACRPADLHRH